MKSSLKAEHFRQLATLLTSGIDAHKAMQILKGQESSISSLIQPVINKLRRGVTLATALEKTGLLMKHEIEILKIAEASGQLPKALSFIANQYEERQSRIGKLKSKLWLPFFVLMIGVIAGILLDLARGSSVLGSLLSGVFLLLMMTMITRYLLSILKTGTFRWLSWGLGLGLQNHSSLFQRYFEYHWYNLFMWQIEAGVDFQNAFHKTESLITNKSYQHKIQHCQQLVQQGHSAVMALTHNHLVFTQDMKQTLQVGEQSGRWSEAVKHHLNIQQDQLKLTTESIFEWIPRIFYVFVICLVLPRLL